MVDISSHLTEYTIPNIHKESSYSVNLYTVIVSEGKRKKSKQVKNENVITYHNTGKIKTFFILMFLFSSLLFLEFPS